MIAPKAHFHAAGGMQPTGFHPSPHQGHEPITPAAPVVEVILRLPSGRSHCFTMRTRSVAAARAAAIECHPKASIVSHRTHLPRACTGFTGHGTHVGE